MRAAPYSLKVTVTTSNETIVKTQTVQVAANQFVVRTVPARYDGYLQRFQ